MIAIAHFSDLHYGANTLEEADRCFTAAIDAAIATRVDAAVVTGDATDHGLDLHEPATLKLVSQIKRLAGHCPVLMLQGTFSHEPPGTLGVFRFLGAKHAVQVADRLQQAALGQDGKWIASEGWRFGALPAGTRALFSCVPAVNKAHVAAAVGAADAGEALGEHLAALLAGFAPINDEARRAGAPTIVLSHGTVFGSLSEHGIPMAGFDHEFTTGALFSASARAVMLGHIHRQQSWTRDEGDGRQCIAYAGSIGRFHYGEEGDKGFIVWRLDADDADFAPISTPARCTVDIVFAGKPDLETLREAVGQNRIEGAHVRVRWTVAEEDRHAVDRSTITRMLAEAHAADTRLEGRIVPVVRVRAPGIAQLDSLADKVKEWARLTGVEAAGVLKCLDALHQGAPAEIAEKVLRAAGDDAPPVVAPEAFCLA
jgi:exonuclease SbcD